MKIVDLDNSEHYQWGDDCHGWHLVSSDDLSVIEELVPPGGAEVRHYHQTSQQFFYVISGTVDLEIDGCHFEIAAGRGMHVTAGQPHQLSNTSQVDARFLVISQPKSHGDRIDL